MTPPSLAPIGRNCVAVFNFKIVDRPQIFLALLFLAGIFLSTAPKASADFSGAHILTPPEPGRHIVTAPLRRTIGGWVCAPTAASVSVDTSLAPDTLTLDTGSYSRGVGAYFVTRAVGSGAVGFEYIITGEAFGSFDWFKGTNFYPDSLLGSNTNLVSTPTAVSFAVQKDEYFGFWFRAWPPEPSGGPNPAVGRRTIRITNFVAPGPALGLSINDILAAEPPDGSSNAVFTVSLSEVSAQTVTVAYATVDETATHGLDYQQTTGTLTFNPGETNKTITVVLLEDAASEGAESFSVSLSSPVNATIDRGAGRCVINDLRITAVEFHVDVSFNTVNQAHYRVEWTEDAINWTPVPGAADVLGTGAIVTIVDRGVACRPNRNYRVRLLQ